jgi:hypothetical protein
MMVVMFHISEGLTRYGRHTKIYKKKKINKIKTQINPKDTDNNAHFLVFLLKE